MKTLRVVDHNGEKIKMIIATSSLS